MTILSLEKGQIASVITALEMTSRPDISIQPQNTDILDAENQRYHLEYWQNPETAPYLDLFRQIGSPWLWFSRLELDSSELQALITHPKIEIYRLRDQDQQIIGLVELDFRQEGQCEIVFFGLSSACLGKKLGHPMMRHTLSKAWRPDVRRVWLHSCSLDHPAALRFYQKHQFRPFQRMIEIHEDPRLTGLLPKEAAPHIPVID
ncbi:acetyltransferase (GNAT) family protein [Zymomonas mobilis]|uniref:Acetyltransferase (GNAT) family protein n=1 Tax=Zymomonas mobilis TaxID=542 RepID=A0A542W1A0_ZYMMB|nr:GNAT family N-acetyltransferase [Zymomonas mobilis]TQL17361.1 acetyltransferase (GNAT) family protein [Zymomonas mobilis]